MNKNKTITKIFIILFTLIIATPLILFALRIKIEPKKNTDRKISLNFKRNFPLKDDLIKASNAIKSGVFNTNAFTEKVIEGNDGWKFIGDSYDDAFSESKGFLLFTEEELVVLKKKLAERKAFLDKQNITYYIAVAPNKLSVYGDKLNITKLSAKTKMTQFETICKSLNINYINLGKQFPKNATEMLYYKTDTHWNFIGGLYGFNEVYKNIYKDFSNNNLKNYKIGDLNKIETGRYTGDLNAMLLLEKNEPFIVYDIKEKITATKIENKLEIPQSYRKELSLYESRYKTDNNDLKIIVMNDSFIDFFKDYFIQNFGESVFIWEHTFRKNMLLAEKPDLLLHEVVERDLDTFLKDLE